MKYPNRKTNKYKRFINVDDIVGKQFGRLKVLKFDHTEYVKTKNNKNVDHYVYHYYVCECQCEKKTIKLVERAGLLKGRTKSCGCIGAEKSRIYNAKLKKDYNAFGRKFYITWKSMKHRCTNPTNTHYKSYGGRGITLDPEWFDFKNFYRDMFASFLEHMKKYGKLDTTLERIDVNGNYCKENCKWATREEQALNKRLTQRFPYQGKMYTAKELFLNFPHHPDLNP